MFDEITASSLVKINLQGEIVSPSPYFINPAGFTIHSAVHAAREDALCVIHLHTHHGIAVSAQKEGLLPISQQSLFALASLSYHDYEGLALNEDEKSRLVADLGNKTNMILRSHGLLTVGKTPAEAFLAMYILESLPDSNTRAIRRRQRFAVSESYLKPLPHNLWPSQLGKSLS